MPLRQRIRESSLVGRIYVRFQEITQRAKHARTVIVFPDQMYSGTAGDLRACAIARELRCLGWRAIVVPPWLSLFDRLSVVRRYPKALLFLQQSRHPLNRPSLYPGRTCVFDADDADILNDSEPTVACLTGSAAAIAGSTFLADRFRAHNPNVHIVWTGTYITAIEAPITPNNRTIITWAQSNPFDYPDEADLVLNLWLRLAQAGKSFVAAIYCTDKQWAELWLAPLREHGIELLIHPRLRYKDFIHSLAGSAIGLQPISRSYAFSQGKSFGKVLGYIAAGVPVIASNAVDHAMFFRDRENGILVETADEWFDACCALLDAPSLGHTIASQAHKDFLVSLTTTSSARKIDAILSDLLLQKIT